MDFRARAHAVVVKDDFKEGGTRARHDALGQQPGRARDADDVLGRKVLDDDVNDLGDPPNAVPRQPVAFCVGRDTQVVGLTAKGAGGA